MNKTLLKHETNSAITDSDCEPDPPRIISNPTPTNFDIHDHTMKVNSDWASPMCPWFLWDIPGGDPTQQPPSFMSMDCVDPFQPAKNDKEMQEEVIKRITDFKV